MNKLYFRRCFSLNFESNAFIYDKSELCTMENIIDNDMNFCSELTVDI